MAKVYNSALATVIRYAEQAQKRGKSLQEWAAECNSVTVHGEEYEEFHSYDAWDFAGGWAEAKHMDWTRYMEILEEYRWVDEG